MSSAMESAGSGGGGVNKYLHKKFKKQTSIEIEAVYHVPSVTPHQSGAALPNMAGGGVYVDERLPQLPDAYPSTNSDVTALMSSITYPTSFGPRRGKAYSLDLVKPREELAGTTALLALRKVDSTSSEQSDEDISQGAAKIRRSPPKLPPHPQPLLQHEQQLSSSADERLLAEDVHSASTSTTVVAVNGGKYVCPFCSLACSKPSVLQKHIRAHTNERPYPCQSCNFSFKTRSNLYKHCRSRTHVNRVMGNKGGGGGGGGAGSEGESNAASPPPPTCQASQQADRPSVIADVPTNREDAPKAKPYKPRFHTKSYYENENEENSLAISNEKNTDQPATLYYAAKIFNVCDQLLNSGSEDAPLPYNHIDQLTESCKANGEDQPLNLTSKRKRCLSEVSSEPAKKSLIKELLLKNLSADTNLQCQHCKMIFRTFTELELHKMKMCKGRGGSRYNRSSSVNVASILTQNKNTFDNIPPMESVFSLKSPGPFLGKTRLVESDKSKSFSCEDGIQVDRFNFCGDAIRKPNVKLFGGEVKVTQPANQSDKEEIVTYPHSEHTEKSDYHVSPKVSENRVIRNTLQSGGIVVHAMQEKQNSVIKSSEKLEMRGTAVSNAIYANLMDFSQTAAKLLAPNLKQLNLAIPGTPTSTKFNESAKPSLLALSQSKSQTNVISVGDTTDPMNLLVNGKVVRYVPGMPGPVIAESIKPKPAIQITPTSDGGDRLTRIQLSVKHEAHSPPTTNASTTNVKMETLEPPPPPPAMVEAPRKFARPNSLALKPSSTSLKHHHGLTPTMFNQILISPDTPRGDKKYNEQLMNGYYYSNLGLKSSTKPVYCTLNKTQPFYVPHFRKLSMYSEWRQQDKGDKWFVLQYNSRQRDASFSIAGKYTADNVVHSSYKFIPGDVSNKKEETSTAVTVKPFLGGYESHEEYTYIRGRGRGRYVCDQCGIRCRKPSILRKHILTHTNDRPYMCAQCDYSFKTKGNLTKHMKSKAHMQNRGEPNRQSIARFRDAPLPCDTDTDDSGMDSSDDASTRIQEHEAAYGLLSLSQKVNSTAPELPSPSATLETVSRSFVNAEQLAHVFNTNYVKNKILDKTISLSAIKLAGTVADTAKHESLARPAEFRPLTYPYTTPITIVLDEPAQSSTSSESVSSDHSSEQNITHFNVIKRYNRLVKPAPMERIKEPVYRSRKPISPVQVDHQIESTLAQVVIQQSPQPAKENRKQIVYPSLPPPQPAEDMPFTASEESEAMDLSFHQEDEGAKVGRHDMIYHPKDKHRVETDDNKYRWRPDVADHHPVRQQLEDDDHQMHVRRSVPRNNVIAPNNIIQTDGLLKLREINEREYDNSAMETLADIATKQEKLEKNSVAKNVATEFLKLATKNESLKTEEKSFGVPTSVVSAIKLASSVKCDLIVKSEENKNCTICHKTFNKPSQLRLHMNIHYLERPYRCDSCSVSFRTKGHLQKHERSAGHHNKLTSSPALLSQEPRPFKCIDCNIAFRIHGHLAKHLRSKMHILKLECLSKIPFGLYAELERSNSLLTEINTADGDQCLDSLKTLARRIFSNDPGKLTQLNDMKTMEYQSETTAS